MESANPAPIQGPIIVGQLDIKRTSQSPGQPVRADLIRRLRVFLTSSSVLGCASLMLAALLHHQIAAILCTLVTIAPVPILTAIIVIYERRDQPAERIVMIVDWLKQMPPMSLFSDSERTKLGWLTDEGLYTFTKSYYPWGRLKICSLEPNVQVAPFETSHLLVLQAHEKNATKTRLLLMFLGFLLIIILVALSFLLIFLRQYGLRDDVLSLMCAIIFDILAWMVFSTALFKIRRDRKQGWKLPFFVNVRHVQLDDLTKFVKQHR